MHKERKASQESQDNSIRLISFATKNFFPAAQMLNNRARRLKFDSIKIYCLDDLDQNFVTQHREILSYPRGAGYWLWKPWIVNKQIQEMKSNEVCLYLDAGAVPCKPAYYFHNLASDGKIHVWLDTNSIFNSNRCWTDPNVWQKIVGSDSGFDTVQAWAGAIVFSNLPELSKIIMQWLSLSCDAQLLCPDKDSKYVFSQGQLGHRHDQSILNCLLNKYPDAFHLHQLKDEFIIHRRGNLSNEPLLLAFRILRFLYWKVMPHFPSSLRKKILQSRTKKRRPHIQNSELKTHEALW